MVVEALRDLDFAVLHCSWHQERPLCLLKLGELAAQFIELLVVQIPSLLHLFLKLDCQFICNFVSELDTSTLTDSNLSAFLFSAKILSMLIPDLCHFSIQLSESFFKDCLSFIKLFLP